MADEEKKERKALIVTSVGSKREPSAGNPVVGFGAHERGNEEAKAGYETWGTDLVNMVVLGAVLDCEITHKVKGDQVTLRVTQMFDDKGNPIRATQRRSGGYSGGGYGKSDYQVTIERTSIEGQTGYNGIIELLKGKVIDLDHVQAKTALEYAEKKMREGMKPPPAPPAETKQAKSEAKPPESVTKPPPGAEEAKVTEAMLTEMRKVAKDKGYTTEIINTLVLEFDVKEAKELTVSKGNQLLDKLKKGEGLLAEPEPAL